MKKGWRLFLPRTSNKIVRALRVSPILPRMYAISSYKGGLRFPHSLSAASRGAKPLPLRKRRKALLYDGGRPRSNGGANSASSDTFRGQRKDWGFDVWSCFLLEAWGNGWKRTAETCLRPAGTVVGFSCCYIIQDTFHFLHACESKS